MLGLEELHQGVERLNQIADGMNVELVLVGGCAVLALAGEGEATRDVDVLRTSGIVALEERLGQDRWADVCRELELSTRAHMFLAHLPLDWEDRVVLHPQLSLGSVEVITPSAEDLVVMKILRLNSKDAGDIRTLSGLAGFDPVAMRRLFASVLPLSLGRPSWHAQSFAMVWNRLFPDQPVTQAQILAEAGITEKD
jgi:hypothetical protein